MGTTSKYSITQVEFCSVSFQHYSGGFAEVLEIRDPPSISTGHIVHIYLEGYGSIYFDFKLPSQAGTAFKAVKHLIDSKKLEDAVMALTDQAWYESSGGYTKNPWWKLET